MMMYAVSVKLFTKFSLCLVLLFLICLVLTSSAQAAATYTIIDDSTGGQCQSIGTWDSASKTCTLTTDLPGLSSAIEIAGNDITLDGAGHFLKGTYFNPGYSAITITGRSGNTIKNVNISYYSGITITNSNNNQIINNTLFHSGIYLYKSEYNLIDSNDASYGGTIFIDSSNNNTISSNISHHSLSWGIILRESSYNMISDNDFHNNAVGMKLQLARYNSVVGNKITGNQEQGIYLTSDTSYNLISTNTVASNKSGLSISGSRHKIIENNIKQNSTYGLYLNAFYTEVYNNNFISNTSQASSNSGANIFNLGAPTGGNYWNDFDEAFEGCSDGNTDGFCDSAYTLIGSTDHLPLIKPIGWPENKPQLVLGCPSSYWSSYQKYISRELSVDWTIRNISQIDALDVRLIDISNTGGVLITTPLPSSIGNIMNNSASQVTLNYDVPVGVIKWQSSLQATGSNNLGFTYTYP